MNTNVAEKVVMFRAIDGSLHATEQACFERNFEVDVRPKVKKSLGDKLISELAQGDLDALSQVDHVCDFLTNWMTGNAKFVIETLAPMVNPIVPPRRTRRTKAEIALEKAAASLKI